MSQTPPEGPDGTEGQVPADDPANATPPEDEGGGGNPPPEQAPPPA